MAEDSVVIQSIETGKLPGAQKRGLVFCHGFDDNWDSPFNDGTMGPMISSIVASGPWVVYSVAAGGNAWGNDTAVANVSTAVDVLRSGYGVSAASIYGLGTSMGNLPIMNSWKADTTLFRRAVGLIPIVALDAVHAGDLQGGAASINAAYGGSWVTATEQAAHDPFYYADSVVNVAPFGATGDWLGFGSGADAWQPGSIWADFAASNDHLNFQEITALGGHSWDQVALVSPYAVINFLTSGQLPG